MIYTVGYTESYEQYFKEQDCPKKLGEQSDPYYPGGSVWKTREEAESHAGNGFSVYGVDADWYKHTTPNRVGGDWHNLIISARLIKLDQGENVENLC